MRSRIEDQTIIEAVNSWASTLGLKENVYVDSGSNFMREVHMGPEECLSVALVFKLKISPFESKMARHQLYDQLGAIEDRVRNAPVIAHTIGKLEKERDALKERVAQLEKYETYYKMQMELNHGPELITEVKRD